MKNYRILVGALAALAMTACSDDKGDSPKNPGETTDAFVRVNIMSNQIGGRASTTNADFELGGADENAIQNISLIFYDSRGNYLSDVALGESDIKAADNNETNNVELVKTVEAKVPISNGIFPSYMMVYVNPVQPNNLSDPLTTMALQTRSSYLGQNSKFAMNNSAYYNASGTYCRSVTVSKENFYQTEAEKETATEVDVYVERLAAKVTLRGRDGSEGTLGEQSGEISGKRLKFVVTGWGLNAEATETYLCKNIGDEFSTVRSIMGSANNATASNVWWNDPDKKRSYWAFTPFYTKPADNITGTGSNAQYKFPFVSDQVGDGNVLEYHSLNEMGKRINESDYTMENTVHSSFYNNNPYKNSSLISAVVAGYYTVDDKKDIDFYVQGSELYLEEDFLKAMIKQGAVIVNNDGTGISDDKSLAELKEIFEIKHPTTPIVGDVTRGVEENKVTIQFKDNAANRSAYKYKLGNADPVEITNDNIGEIQERLYGNCGLSSKYTKGYAYFNVPIRHLVPEVSEGDALPAGYYGVVRNHHYVITVDGFADLTTATLGKGVLDPDKPIVPPTDPDDKFGIKAKVRVLSWRLVKQTVTLGQ